MARKLVPGISGKDLRWLNKPFVFGFGKSNRAGVGAAIIGLPCGLFFGAWFITERKHPITANAVLGVLYDIFFTKSADARVLIMKT